MELDYSSFSKAVDSLERALSYMNENDIQDERGIELLHAGVVQNFEVVYEMSWKFMKRWLQAYASTEDVSAFTRKELYREAHTYKLIENTENWFLYYSLRNQTSHTYNFTLFAEVLDAAPLILQDCKILLENLKKRND